MRSPPSPSMTAACQVRANTPSSSPSGMPRPGRSGSPGSRLSFVAGRGLLGREPAVEGAHHQHEEAQRGKDDAHASQDDPGGLEHAGIPGLPFDDGQRIPSLDTLAGGDMERRDHAAHRGPDRQRPLQPGAGISPKTISGGAPGEPRHGTTRGGASQTRSPRRPRHGILPPPRRGSALQRRGDAMHFELSDELKALVQVARDFAAEKIAPFVETWDAAHYFPYREVVKPMAQLGFLGTGPPEEDGGNNMGWLAAMIVSEEIARACSSLRVQINMETLGCAFPILRYGSEELKRRYIPKLVSADYLGGFAITEPTAGSDVTSMKSRVEDKGDYWMLNGRKAG